MPDKRIVVWVQRLNDRPHLVLCWPDLDTRRIKSKSAETADPKQADAKPTDLEAHLNNGRDQEAARMSWERFTAVLQRYPLPAAWLPHSVYRLA